MSASGQTRRFHDVRRMSAEPRQRPALVAPHQAGVADNLRGQIAASLRCSRATGSSPAFVDRGASSTQDGTTLDALRGGWNTRSGYSGLIPAALIIGHHLSISEPT
jgi:hypothetical protein